MLLRVLDAVHFGVTEQKILRGADLLSSPIFISSYLKGIKVKNLTRVLHELHQNSKNPVKSFRFARSLNEVFILIVI